MKSRLLIPVMAACCAIIACAPRYAVSVPGPSGGSPDAESSIRELMVRNLIATEPAGDIVLISFGASRLDNVDPPQAFFERLAGVPVTVKPASQYDAAQHPNALLIVVHDVQPASDTEANVAVTRFRYGVGASDGFTAAVEWRDGVWKIAETSRHWST
ncbi:MAG TPA: hypothetical protein VFT13_14120 [Candidatus Krumholzibacteria bacterium]|nr:hypothetical protein [Candidatus Krumholzibacteria bacterium]